jgi:GTP cyclohydrolase I/GTP cyclohydrolase-4
VGVPTAGTALSRVGLERVDVVVLLGAGGRSAQPLPARLECLVEPDPRPRAAGSPRVEEVVTDALRDVVTGHAATRAERLAQAIAERVRERQGARRVEVAIAARFPEARSAPVSGIPTQEVSTLHARAVASEHETRWMVGVAAQGMTTSPHGQSAVAARARARLVAGGFSDAQIVRALDAVPVATHDQIGVGTLHLGCSGERALDVDAAVLLAIVQNAMSSEIFELLKRADEAAVVERAHRRPRTVQDCVGAMIAEVVGRFGDAPDDAFVSAAQQSTETIHGHHVTAGRDGLMGDLRRELQTGRAVAPGMSVRRWLDAR